MASAPDSVGPRVADRRSTRLNNVLSGKSTDVGASPGGVRGRRSGALHNSASGAARDRKGSLAENKSNAEESQADMALGHAEEFKTAYIFQPKKFIRILLSSIAGQQWLAVRKKTKLMPLRFVDPKEERDYIEELTKTYRYKLPLAAWTLLVAGVISWILIAISWTDWADIIRFKPDPNWILYAFHICVSIAVTSCLLLLLSPRIPVFKRSLEFYFYIFAGINGMAFFIWTLFAVVWGYHNTDWSDPNPYKMALLMQDFSELKMICDAFSTAIFAAVLILCDILLDTRSSVSIWFHLFMFGMYAAARLAQNHAISEKYQITSNIDVGLGAVLYALGWLSRWFRELNDRSVYIRIRESQANVAAMRDATKQRRRRSDQSAAEELLDLLNSCQETIDRHLTEGGPRESLVETKNYVRESIQSLARGNDQDMTRRTGEAGIEEIEEDVFINMYKMDKASVKEMRLGGAEAASRRTRQSSLVAGPGGGSDGSKQGLVPETMVSNVKLPELKMAKVFEKDLGHDIGFRMLDHKAVPNLLSEVGLVLLRPYYEHFEKGGLILRGFLYALQRNYWEGNPYHNELHAANVAHCAVALLNMFELEADCSLLEKIGFILAALGHDVGHPGKSNTFLINCNSSLAIFQNDSAVLEATHCSILHSIINACGDTNVLAFFTHAEYTTIRKIIIQMILSTDMSKHFEIISKSRVRRASPQFDIKEQEQDRLLFLTLIFKSADVSHTILEWNAHVEWTLRLSEEYYQQGAEEAALGLPISPLCNKKDHDSIGRTQAGYLQFVVLPLVEELLEFDANGDYGIDILLTKLIFNKQKWEGIISASSALPAPEGISSQKIAPATWPVFCLQNTLRAARLQDLIAPITPAALAKWS